MTRQTEVWLKKPFGIADNVLAPTGKPLAIKETTALRFTRILPLAALASMAWTPEAHAYIDPTAAGAALQSGYVILISALMAVALVPKKIAAGFMWIKSRLMPGAKPAASEPQE
jgi:hypothetical protein